MLTKDVKDIYGGHFKSLNEEILQEREERQCKWIGIDIMKVYPIRRSLQVQCNPNQNSHLILHRNKGETIPKLIWKHKSP